MGLFAATDWTAISAIASSAAALGTLVLAFVTWHLASSTNDLAAETRSMAAETSHSVELAERELSVVTDQSAATRDQVEISGASLRAANQPLIVAVIRRERNDAALVIASDGQSRTFQLGADALCAQDGGPGGDTWAVVPVRNVGTGVAVIPATDGAVRMRTALYGGMAVRGRPSSRLLAPGDIVDLVFHSPSGVGANEIASHVATATVVVEYTNLAGDIAWTTRLQYRQYRPPNLLDAVVAVGRSDLAA